MPRKVFNKEANFWSRVDVKSPEECWEYKTSKNKAGYARIRVGTRTLYAHRYAWELRYKQEVPKGMKILHHCDNPSCVNHNHLYCGTPGDNMLDRKQLW